MAYYVIYAPDDTVTAISIFNDYAGAEESNRRALAWIATRLRGDRPRTGFTAGIGPSTFAGRTSSAAIRGVAEVAGPRAKYQ